MKAISAGTIFTGFAACALFMAPLAVASPEDAYLNVLDEAGVTWPGATSDNMIAAGKGVCTDWANGATLEGEISNSDQSSAGHNSECTTPASS